MLKAALQVVDKMVVRNVRFCLAPLNGNARGFVALPAKSRVINARRPLHVVGGDLRLLHERRGNLGRVLALWLSARRCGVRLINQIGPVLRVQRVPHAFPRADLLGRGDVGRLRSEGDRFRCGCAVVVIKLLRIAREADHRVAIALVLERELAADHGNDRNKLSRPLKWAFEDVGA